MLFGFAGWETIVGKLNWVNWDAYIIESFPRRSIDDLKAIARQIMRACLAANPPNLEVDVVTDIQSILNAEESRLKEGTELETIPEEIPYPGANEKQIFEYRSFLLDAAPEYMEHIQKKAKNLLSRIQMVHFLYFRHSRTETCSSTSSEKRSSRTRAWVSPLFPV